MDRVCVIGLGRFGMVLAEKLASEGLEVLAIDNDQQHVERIKDNVALAIRADGTDINVLRSVGVDSTDAVVISIGQDFEAAQLALMAVKELKVPKIVVRANDDVKRRILKHLGAGEVVMPEEDAAERLARRLSKTTLTESIELGREFSIAQMPTPRKLIGRSIKDLGIREKFNLNLIAIKSMPSQTMVMSKKDLDHSANATEVEARIHIPTGLTTIHNGDTLIIVGRDVDIERFSHENQ